MSHLPSRGVAVTSCNHPKPSADVCQTSSEKICGQGERGLGLPTQALPTGESTADSLVFWNGTKTKEESHEGSGLASTSCLYKLGLEMLAGPSLISQGRCKEEMKPSTHNIVLACKSLCKYEYYDNYGSQGEPRDPYQQGRLPAT